MPWEIEEVTVKDGIVRITALNCSEENLQKLERLRDDCYQKELQFVFDTRNNKSDCISYLLAAPSESDSRMQNVR